MPDGRGALSLHEAAAQHQDMLHRIQTTLAEGYDEHVHPQDNATSALLWLGTSTGGRVLQLAACTLAERADHVAGEITLVVDQHDIDRAGLLMSVQIQATGTAPIPGPVTAAEQLALSLPSSLWAIAVSVTEQGRATRAAHLQPECITPLDDWDHGPMFDALVSEHPVVAALTLSVAARRTRA